MIRYKGKKFMSRSVKERIKLNNKIFPVFYGLSADLIFYIAISGLFLTEVKELNASEINFIFMLGNLVALPVYLFAHRIIKKIGNVTSVRIGTFLMLLAPIFITFSTNIVFLAIGQMFYAISFVFRCVDSVILNNNLNYENRGNEFLKIRSQATTIYSIATLIAALLSGLLFAVNPYIPMIICIVICLNNFLLSFFIYEVQPDVKSREEKIKEKGLLTKFRLGKVALMAIIAYGLTYSLIAVSQTNDKLFMQYRLNDFLNMEMVAIVLAVIVFLSRIARLISNIFLIKYSRKFKNRIIYMVNFGLIVSIIMFIIGKLVPSAAIGSIIMAVGFLIILFIRDPAENVFSTILLQNTSKENEEKAMLFFQFARRLSGVLLSLLATVVLLRYELVHLYVIFAILSVAFLFVTIKLVRMINIAKDSYSGKI